MRQTLSFFFFLLVTCVLFMRPTDYFPESGSLYLIVISACLLTSWTVVSEQLSVGSLERRPITAGVLGLLTAMILSILCNLRFELLAVEAFEFVKVTLFYLLMVGLVNSPDRLRCYLLSVAGILTVPIGLAVLHFYGIIHHPAFVPSVVDLYSKERILIGDDGRMRGTGMFGDPNDVCLLINVGMMLSLYGLMSGAEGWSGFYGWLRSPCTSLHCSRRSLEVVSWRLWPASPSSLWLDTGFERGFCWRWLSCR